MINDENWDGSQFQLFWWQVTCFVDEMLSQVLVQHKHHQRQHYQHQAQVHHNHQDQDHNPERLHQNEPKEFKLFYVWAVSRSCNVTNVGTLWTAVISKYLCRCQSSVCLSRHICVQRHFGNAHGCNGDDGYYDDVDDDYVEKHYKDEEEKPSIRSGALCHNSRSNPYWGLRKLLLLLCSCVTLMCKNM